ncbi:MAG: class II fructose-bisphosphate aldolase [Candidatus Falkowbacteria bacterium]
MLVHIKDLLIKAQKGHYAIGAFNTQNLEITLAIIRAAIAQKAPVIIQVSESTIKYAGLKPITHIVQTIAKNDSTNVPIALHLDHGKSFLSILECIKAGFSSIHLDGSELPYDENMSLTKEAATYAHKNKVWAQGELGTILGKEGLLKRKKKEIESDDYMTDPNKAVGFVRDTKIDTLAISVGNMHGMFVGDEHIEFKRLKAIHKKIKVPLVMHGASGIPDKEIKKAIKQGIRVINIDTRLRKEFITELRKTLKSKKTEIDPRKILTPSIDAVQKAVEEKIKLFGSAGKA